MKGWYVANVAPPVAEVYRGWTPCIRWCTQTFGEMRSPNSPPRWRFVSEGIFEFREEQDCALFLLKWQ